MARATAVLSGADYRVEIASRDHRLVSDEPVSGGGQDAGPAPYDLLLASLGSCTAITLKMYADRKGWPLKAVTVGLHYHPEGDGKVIDRTLDLVGDLDETQRARLADIAERTPVTLTLKGGLPITTTLKPDAQRAHIEAELDEALDDSFPASDPPSIVRHGEGDD